MSCRQFEPGDACVDEDGRAFILLRTLVTDSLVWEVVSVRRACAAASSGVKLRPAEREYRLVSSLSPA